MARTASLPVATGQREAIGKPTGTYTRGIGVSVTLAANEALQARRRRGERVLPLAFGEAGVPVAPLLRDALAAASHLGGYGPVAGSAELRAAAAGYWTRRDLPTEASEVVCGPGSKALLYGLLLGLRGVDVAIPRPSWVSYAAQAALTGIRPVYVPTLPGQGGVPDPDLLAGAVTAARREGRRLGAVIVTLPDNPTGTLAAPDTIRALCSVAEHHHLLIISDEIYRDLTPAYATAAAALVPARISITAAAPLVSHLTGMIFSSRQPTTMAAPAAVHSASVAPMPTASGS